MLFQHFRLHLLLGKTVEYEKENLFYERVNKSRLKNENNKNHLRWLMYSF